MNTRTLTLVLVVAVATVAAPAAGQMAMGPERTISNQDFNEYLPHVAYNSNHDEFLVVWHDNSPLQSRSVMGKRVDASGAAIAEFIIAFEDTPPRDNAQPTVAYDPVNDRYMVSWVKDYHGDGSDWDVYGRLIPWNGPSPSLTEFSICDFTSNQWSPRAAYAGTPGEFLVTWWNEGSGGVNSYISAQRISAAGATLGGIVTVTSGTEERVVPDVAYNQARNEYLIVFQLMDAGGGSIHGVRLTGGGSIIGGGDFAIAAWPDPETAPRVAASRVEDEWGVIWQSDVPGRMKDVYARRVWVDISGTVQFTPPVHAAGSTVDERRPDIAIHPESSTYLLAWEKQYSSPTGPLGIDARTLNSVNGLGNRFDVRPVYIGTTIDSSRPSMAASDSNWFVAWEQERNATPPYLDILGRTVYGVLFADDFESGGLSAWSSHNP